MLGIEQLRPTFLQLRALTPAADGRLAHTRSQLIASVALFSCLVVTANTLHAGFVLHSALPGEGGHLSNTWQAWPHLDSEDSASGDTTWQDLASGADPWNGESADSSEPLPDLPNDPFFVVSAALVAGASGRTMTSPPGSSGPHASSAGMFGARCQLPISLLTYQRQQREFLVMPNAPFFELFRPS